MTRSPIPTRPARPVHRRAARTVAWRAYGPLMGAGRRCRAGQRVRVSGGAGRSQRRVRARAGWRHRRVRPRCRPTGWWVRPLVRRSETSVRSGGPPGLRRGVRRGPASTAEFRRRPAGFGHDRDCSSRPWVRSTPGSCGRSGNSCWSAGRPSIAPTRTGGFHSAGSASSACADGSCARGRCRDEIGADPTGRAGADRPDATG